MKVLKWFGIALCISILLFGVWLVISFVDIISHNVPFFDNYGEFLDWNFFVVFFKLRG